MFSYVTIRLILRGSLSLNHVTILVHLHQHGESNLYILFAKIVIIVCLCLLKSFKRGRRRKVWFNKALVRVWNCVKAENGRGFILLLHCHWWTEGTKMPVPGAGKHTDTRQSTGLVIWWDILQFEIALDQFTYVRCVFVQVCVYTLKIF